ncbi:unnamed protein product [Urochloa humidicola]
MVVPPVSYATCHRDGRPAPMAAPPASSADCHGVRRPAPKAVPPTSSAACHGDGRPAPMAAPLASSAAGHGDRRPASITTPPARSCPYIVALVDGGNELRPAAMVEESLPTAKLVRWCTRSAASPTQTTAVRDLGQQRTWLAAARVLVLQ